MSLRKVCLKNGSVFEIEADTSKIEGNFIYYLDKEKRYIARFNVNSIDYEIFFYKNNFIKEIVKPENIIETSSRLGKIQE